MFLPADPLIKDGSKHWLSSVELWSPLMSMGFICLELKDIRTLGSAALQQKWGFSSLMGVAAHQRALPPHSFSIC